MTEESIKTPLLRVREKLGYSLGDFASDLFFMLFIYYGLFFYTDVFGIPAAAVGTMFLVTKFWDSINDPMMGLLADRTNTRFGKFRPYLLWMLVPYGVMGVLAFTSPDFSISGKIVYAYITYTLMMMVYTAINIPYSALMGVMTPNSKDRTSLSSYRFTAAFAGGIFVSGMTLPLLAFYGGGSTDIVTAQLQQDGHLQVSEQGTGTVQAQVTYHALQDKTALANAGWVMKFQSMFEDTAHVEKSTNLWVKDRNALFDQLLYTESGRAKAVTALLGVDKPQVTKALLSLGLNRAAMVEKMSETFGNPHGDRGTAPIKETDVTKVDWNVVSAYLNPASDPFVQQVLDGSQRQIRKVAAGRFDGDIKEAFNDADALAGALVRFLDGLDPAAILSKVDDHFAGLAVSYVDREKMTRVLSPLKYNGKPLALEIDGNFYLEKGFGALDVDLPVIFDDGGESEDVEETARVDWKKPAVKVEVIEPQKGFQRTIMTFAMIAMVFFFIAFLSTKERVSPPKEQNSSIWSDLKDVFSNGPWIVVGVMSLFTLAQFCIYGGAIMYYFKYYVKIPALGGGFMLAGTISNLFGVLATDWLTKLMGGKKRLYFIFSLLTVPLMAAFYYLGPNDIVIMFVLTVLGGILSGPLSPIVWAMYADIADHSEWKTGKRATGLFFSAATFAQKMGWTLGGAAAGWMLAFYGFEANIEQSAESIHGIKMLMSWIPAIGCFIAGILVLFYSLDDKMMVQIEKELVARRKANEAGQEG